MNIFTSSIFWATSGTIIAVVAAVIPLIIYIHGRHVDNHQRKKTAQLQKDLYEHDEQDIRNISGIISTYIFREPSPHINLSDQNYLIITTNLRKWIAIFQVPKETYRSSTTRKITQMYLDSFMEFISDSKQEGKFKELPLREKFIRWILNPPDNSIGTGFLQSSSSSRQAIVALINTIRECRGESIIYPLPDQDELEYNPSIGTDILLFKKEERK